MRRTRRPGFVLSSSISLGGLAILAALAGGCDGDATRTPAVALPRPAPPEEIDRVSRLRIDATAAKVAESPDSVASWAGYGDVCLANLWPSEAVVAYQAVLSGPRSIDEVLGAKVRWRLAEALHQLEAFDEADREATSALEVFESKGGFPAGWVTLAYRRMDAGEIEAAEQALARTGDLDTVRRALVSVPLDLQSGRLPEARATVDRLLAAGSGDPAVSRLAVIIGRAQDDQALIAAHEANAAESLTPGPDPVIQEILPLAMHELADLQRCVLASQTLPPPQALEVIGRVLQRRPELSMARTIAADLLRKLNRFDEAKGVLDPIHDSNPPDHEYWSVDAMVHLELGRSGRTELLDRARTSVDRAIEINPRLAYAWQIKALILEQDAAWDQAATAYRKAAELSTDPEMADRMTVEAIRCETETLEP